MCVLVLPKYHFSGQMSLVLFAVKYIHVIALSMCLITSIITSYNQSDPKNVHHSASKSCICTYTLHVAHFWSENSSPQLDLGLYSHM